MPKDILRDLTEAGRILAEVSLKGMTPAEAHAALVQLFTNSEREIPEPPVFDERNIDKNFAVTELDPAIPPVEAISGVGHDNDDHPLGLGLPGATPKPPKEVKPLHLAR